MPYPNIGSKESWQILLKICSGHIFEPIILLKEVLGKKSLLPKKILITDFHLNAILSKGLFKYLTEKTGAKAKNILILSAIFGIVENVMKAEKKDIS